MVGYFCNIMYARNRVVRGDKRRSEQMEKKDISKEKIRLIIRKIKNRKAARLDGLPGEIWKYGEEEIME